MTHSVSAPAATNGHHRSDLMASPMKISVITPAEAAVIPTCKDVPESRPVKA